MQKTYILDTNILLEDEDAVEVLRNGEENKVIILYTVLEELDKLKNNQKLRPQVSKVIKNLNEWIDEVEITKKPSKGDSNPDNIILEEIKELKQERTDDNIVFVTNDNLLRFKARKNGIESEEYKSSKPFNRDYEVYSGFIEPGDEPIPNCFYWRNGELWHYTGRKEKTIKSNNNVWNVEPKNPHQNAAFELLMNNNINVVTLLSEAGLGKAQPLYSKVLTPNGWKYMGDIERGDRVFDMNSNICKVTDTFPQGEKDIYEVKFNDGTSTKCCNEHLWVVSRENVSPWKTKNTEELKDDLVNEKKKRHKWFIPVIDEPLEFNQRDVLRIDPYIMGCLLGDGSFRSNNIMFSSENKEVIDKVQGKLEEMNFTLNRRNKYDFSINMNRKPTVEESRLRNEGNVINEFKKEIIRLGLFNKKSEEKFIPLDYLFSSKEERLELLKGLMDTDGGMENTHAYFYTSSEKLKEDFTFLCKSLGFKTACTEKQPKYVHNGEKRKGKTSYNIRISHNKLIPFSTEYKVEKFNNTRRYPPSKCIKEINYIGREEAKCITVDSHTGTYITDDFIITHNTFLALASALHLTLQDKTYSKIYVVRRNSEIGEDLGYLPGDVFDKMSPHFRPIHDLLYKLHDIRKANKIFKNPEDPDEGFNSKKIEFVPPNFMRGMNIEDAVVIIDEVTNFPRYEVRTMLTRMGQNVKCICTGDTRQIDNIRLNSENNGLNWMIKFLTGFENYGHITLKGRKSRGPITDIVRKSGL